MKNIYNNLVITVPDNNGKGLSISGPVDIPLEDYTAVENCTIDFSNAPTNKQMVNISFIKGASAVVKNCVFRNSVNLALCGNDDYPIEDNNGRVIFENCVFMNFGGYGIEAQDGVTVKMKNCVIWNWGVSKYFDTRTCAIYVHDNAKVKLNKCVFLQSKFWQYSPFKMLKDIANHVSHDWNNSNWNNKSLSWKSFLPGVMKDAIESNSGVIRVISRVYKNKRWIRIDKADNKLYDYMSRYDARCVILNTFNSCGLSQEITDEAVSLI